MPRYLFDGDDPFQHLASASDDVLAAHMEQAPTAISGCLLQSCPAFQLSPGCLGSWSCDGEPTSRIIMYVNSDDYPVPEALLSEAMQAISTACHIMLPDFHQLHICGAAAIAVLDDIAEPVVEFYATNIRCYLRTTFPAISIVMTTTTVRGAGRDGNGHFRPTGEIADACASAGEAGKEAL